MFESARAKREQREKEERELEIQAELDEQRRYAERKQKERDAFIQSLDEKILTSPVICIRTYNNYEKELAFNHLFSKGYVCVQNEISHSSGNFILTFAKKDQIGNFI